MLTSEVAASLPGVGAQQHRVLRGCWCWGVVPRKRRRKFIFSWVLAVTKSRRAAPGSEKICCHRKACGSSSYAQLMWNNFDKLVCKNFLSHQSELIHHGFNLCAILIVKTVNSSYSSFVDLLIFIMVLNLCNADISLFRPGTKSHLYLIQIFISRSLQPALSQIAIVTKLIITPGEIIFWTGAEGVGLCWDQVLVTLGIWLVVDDIKVEPN